MSVTAEQALSAAQAAFLVSSDPSAIKESTERLRAVLATWRAQSEAVEKTIRTFLAAAQSMCSHPDAHRGYNERDGDWQSPCPTCGGGAR